MDDIIHGHVIPESKLAAMAKAARLSADLTQAEAARRLNVSRPAIAQAENEPKRNLKELRLKMIATFSGGYEAAGAFYVIKRKTARLRDGDLFL